MIPVLVFTLVYNVPKFFELYTERVAVDAAGHELPNSTLAEANWTMTVLRPTKLRLDEWYIRIYILWMNLLLHIIGPFILLIVLNVRTYNKIKDFERTLSDTLRIRFTSIGGGETSPNIPGRRKTGVKRPGGGKNGHAEGGGGENGGGGGGGGGGGSDRLLSGEWPSPSPAERRI